MDTFDFSAYGQALSITLASNQWLDLGQGHDVITGFNDRDLYLPADVVIENITGTNFSDTLVGNTFSNVINGGMGDDTLRGGNADDILTGGSGSDTLEGGTGSDIFNYTAIADGSTTAGDGDKIASSDWIQGTDTANFSQAVFGNLPLGGVAFLSNGAFDTNASTTLANLTTTAGTDSEGYYVDLEGQSLTTTLYGDIEEAIFSGSAATGAGFIALQNGNRDYEPNQGDPALGKLYCSHGYL